ncbi:hypothetical protein C8Q79DRAFT_151106 [Trametes meyenii]|nr:hypothetical protein C8Q79DRAFT_151106 [Trametes meyenii]
MDSTPPDSSPAPSEDRLIPPPATGIGRSYVRYVRPEDRGTFEEAKILMRELCPRELNIKRRWGLQQMQATERLIARVVERYPVFKKYEGAWPVMYYCYKHFSHLRRPFAKRMNVDNLRSQVEAVACYGRLLNPLSRTRRASKLQVPAPNECSIDSEPPATTNPQEPWGEAGNEKDDTSVPDLLNCPSSQLSSTDTLSSSSSSASSSVLDFLVALDGSLASMLDRFRFAGITDTARLRSLAQWPAPEQELFLAKDLGLNAFERRMHFGR